jgi:hypothetical protein
VFISLRRRVWSDYRVLQRLAHRLETVVGREGVERVEIECEEALVAQDVETVVVARRNPESDRRAQERVAGAQKFIERIGIGREQPPVHAADEAADFGRSFW